MYNFDYLIAALVYIAVSWIHFNKTQTLRDTNLRIFLMFLIAGIFDIILDMLSSYIIELHNPSLNGIGVFVTTFLYILQVIIPFVMLIYGISLRNISRNRIIKEIITWSICPALMILIVIGNVFFGYFFQFDSAGNYIHGPAYIAMYVYATALSVYLGIFIIIYKDELTKFKRKVLWELLFITVSCVILQAFYSDVLLTGFGIGLGLVVLMQTINNPLLKTDNLTGKLDQNSMYEMMKELLNKKLSFHIISLNISQLRQINSIFGTKAGDEFILQLINQLDEFVNVPIFRLAGKRFAIVFTDYYEYSRTKIKIKEMIGQNNHFDQTVMTFPIVACAVSFANKINSEDSILNYIDFLLNRVDSKKGHLLIDSKDETFKAYLYQKEVEKYIPGAIKNKEFKVFYQPIFDVKQQKFVAVEALSRLFHPELGYITPDIFIEIAQKSEQIREIDTIQFENVCRFLDENRSLLTSLENVKVNVSPLDMIQPGFCEKRLAMIKKYNLPPSFFQFEITETLASVYSDAVKNDIEKLKNEGIGFCMDDFGSGYANLCNVIEMPFSVIKIDRSILIGILEDKRKAQLYKGTVEGFKNLNLTVVCEGIEKEEEYELLKSWGVDMIQGYYFSRPLSENDLLEKIEKNAQ